MGKRKYPDSSDESYVDNDPAEQPPEEGTDPHEAPPIDGPIATQTSTPDLPPLAEGDPELEPPPSPLELRAAPVVEDDREEWGDALPSWQELSQATTIEARTKDPRSSGIYVGGERITRDARDYSVQSILLRTEGHLRAFLTEPAVQVRVKQ
jgi:hypothetical protein